MAGKQATLSQVKQVVALREAGATRAVIASEVGVSISTVSRICKRFGSSKGYARHQLVEEARAQLLKRLTNDHELLQEATQQLADDIISGRIIRDKITEAVLRLQLSDPDELTNVLRALNSASSALASIQKVGRIATGVDSLVERQVELPVLQIREMTAEDIQAVKEQLEESRHEEDRGDLDESMMVH